MSIYLIHVCTSCGPNHQGPWASICNVPKVSSCKAIDCESHQWLDSTIFNISLCSVKKSGLDIPTPGHASQIPPYRDNFVQVSVSYIEECRLFPEFDLRPVGHQPKCKALDSPPVILGADRPKIQGWRSNTLTHVDAIRNILTASHQHILAMEQWSQKDMAAFKVLQHLPYTCGDSHRSSYLHNSRLSQQWSANHYRTKALKVLHSMPGLLEQCFKSLLIKIFRIYSHQTWMVFNLILNLKFKITLRMFHTYHEPRMAKVAGPILTQTHLCWDVNNKATAWLGALVRVTNLKFWFLGLGDKMLVVCRSRQKMFATLTFLSIGRRVTQEWKFAFRLRGDSILLVKGQKNIRNFWFSIIRIISGATFTLPVFFLFSTLAVPERFVATQKPQSATRQRCDAMSSCRPKRTFFCTRFGFFCGASTEVAFFSSVSMFHPFVEYQQQWFYRIYPTNDLENDKS